MKLYAVALALAVVLLLVLLIAAAVAVGGAYRMYNYYTMFDHHMRTPRAKLSEVYDDLKTGDIILFVSAVHSPINSVLTQTFHSHAGLVIREGPLMWVAETNLRWPLMPRGKKGAKFWYTTYGAKLTPFLPRLKYYVGDYYVLRLSRPLDPAREAAVARRARRLQEERTPYPSVAQSLLGILGARTASRHCFQHVAHLLDTARLSPVDVAPADAHAPPYKLEDEGFADVCRVISNIAGRELQDGYRYLPLVQLMYDIDAVTFTNETKPENAAT